MNTMSENVITPNIQFELKLVLTELLMHFGDCTFMTITNVHAAAVTWDSTELSAVSFKSWLHTERTTWSICRYQ